MRSDTEEARRLLAESERVRTHEERVALLLKAQVHALLATSGGTSRTHGAELVDPLWTISDVQRETGIPVATLRSWRANGLQGPPAIKLGSRLRYRRSEVLAWIEASKERHEGEGPGK